MNAPLYGEVVRFPDAADLARAAADGFAELAAAAVAERGRFAVALTGGGSPRDFYLHLSLPPWRDRIPWHGVHLFWGDERCVPPRHPRSNYSMARDLFVSRVPIPPGNVHRIKGELRPEVAAAEYAVEIDAFFDGDEPRLDLVHLGLGDDGHVASLFPFDLPRLTERERPVTTSLFGPLGEHRITLSYLVINAARRVEFLLPDRDKAGIAARAMAGPLDPFRVPAQGVRPTGELVWLSAI